LHLGDQVASDGDIALGVVAELIDLDTRARPGVDEPDGVSVSARLKHQFHGVQPRVVPSRT
jgi:hypothetical protein